MQSSLYAPESLHSAVCKVQVRKHYISLPSVVKNEEAASLMANGPLYSCLLILPSCPPKCFYLLTFINHLPSLLFSILSVELSYQFLPLLPPTLVGTFSPTRPPNPTTSWTHMQLRYITNYSQVPYTSLICCRV